MGLEFNPAGGLAEAQLWLVAWGGADGRRGLAGAPARSEAAADNAASMMM